MLDWIGLDWIELELLVINDKYWCVLVGVLSFLSDCCLFVVKFSSFDDIVRYLVLVW